MSKDFGVNLLIRIVLVGLLPVKTLKGKRKAATSFIKLFYQIQTGLVLLIFRALSLRLKKFDINLL
jgi:hypothetical protein